jgi:hypothetical protein
MLENTYIKDNCIYYISDIKSDGEDSGSICRMDIDGKNKEIILDENIESMAIEAPQLQEQFISDLAVHEHRISIISNIKKNLTLVIVFTAL